MMPVGDLSGAEATLYRLIDTKRVNGCNEPVGVLEHIGFDHRSDAEKRIRTLLIPEHWPSLFCLNKPEGTKLASAGTGIVRLDPLSVKAFSGVNPAGRPETRLSVHRDFFIHARTRLSGLVTGAGDPFAHATVTFRSDDHPWLLRDQLDELDRLLGGDEFYVQASPRIGWRMFLHMRTFDPTRIALVALFFQDPIWLPQKGKLTKEHFSSSLFG